MKSISEEMDRYQKDNLNAELKKSYVEALKKPEFKKLITLLKVKEDVALKYTSKLEATSLELLNCSNCKNLYECKNKIVGHVYYPDLEKQELLFNYVPCKYQKKEEKELAAIKTEFFQIPLEIKKAKMADIDLTDKNRLPINKWLSKFYKDYQGNKHLKGLYLHGSFGSGKTYLISALLNELASEGAKSVIIYYPELLRNLKEAFDDNTFAERIKMILAADLLLLDDIGAETVSSWNRDEILGTILQYRMDNKLPTFFTSNLNLKELESHFITKKEAEEQIKARRIIERIKQITDTQELISENRRK